MNMADLIDDKEQYEQDENDNLFSEPLVFKINNLDIKSPSVSNLVFINANKYKSDKLYLIDGKITTCYAEYIQGNDFVSFINSLDATSYQIGKILIICDDLRTLLSPMTIAYYDFAGNRNESLITKEKSSYQKSKNQVELLVDFKLDKFTEIVFSYIKYQTSIQLYLYPYAINDINEYGREFDEPNISGIIFE